MIYDGKQTIFNHAEQYSLVRLIQSEEDSSVKKYEEGKSSVSLKLARYLSTSGLGVLFDLSNVILSLAMTFLHCLDPHTDNSSASILILEIVLNVSFISYFVLNLFIAENKFFYILSTSSLIEYVAVIPSLMAGMQAISRNELINLTRVFRLFSVQKFDKILARHSKEVARQYFKLFNTILRILIIMSAVLLVVEGDQSEYSILDWLYFMVVTMTTVGFGDVTPKSQTGRMAVIFALLIILALIPTQWQELTKVISLQSKFARVYFKKNGDSDHIILLGDTQIEGFKTFLGELYHIDHGVTDMQTVIMRSTKPSEEELLLLKTPSFQSKVMYLEGNAINQKDLKRCAVDSSKCVVILANKQSNNPIGEDYKNILNTFSVKQYAKMMTGREIRVCLQLLKPENKDLYFSGLSGSKHDQVICVDEIKLYLLAKTCLCPGINTIISLLITSNKPSYENKSTNKEKTWIDEYLYGMQNEIYRVPFESKVFLGLSFNLVVEHLYKELDYILIALEINVLNETKVFLNPSDYVFQDHLHYGYVLANSLPDIDKLKNFKFPDQIQRNMQVTYNFDKIKKSLRNMIESRNYFSDVKRLKQALLEEKDSKSRSFFFTKTAALYTSINSISNMDENKFENHFIVCGIVPGMKHLLLPLRAKSLKTINPVIILYNDPMPTEIWKQINRFPKVYFMQGSPLKLMDLERACIHKAQTVVILSKHSDNENTNIGMIDADTIFIYKTVKLLNPNIRIITELASINTISFLSNSRSSFDDNKQGFGYISSEPFASGEIYISTMLDTLICQAFYNPFITSILDQIIMGNANLTVIEKKIHSSMKLQQSNLFMISLPTKFIDKKFGELFDTLILENKIIPLGLYRCHRAKPYVFVKPPPDLILNVKDKVYVLCPKQPKEFESNEVETEEKYDIFKENDPMNLAIKSRLQGEEGRIDTEQARELNKINMEMSSLGKDLTKINSDLFSKELIKKDLVPKIRLILRDELSKS